MLLAAGLLATASLPSMAAAATETYSVLFAGRNVGHLKAESTDTSTTIDFDFKNNGRGPTISETLTRGADGLPTAWTIKGATTFGGKVDERFTLVNGDASWTDSTGTASAKVREPSLYIGQAASPWALGMYARALLKDSDRTMPGLPGGTIRLERNESFTANGDGGRVEVTAYSLSGIDLNPSHLLLDAEGDLFAQVSGRAVIVRKGYEGEETRLRALAEKLSSARFAAIQKATAHDYGAPLRIRNVRLFDPRTTKVTEPKSVLVFRDSIASVQAVDAPATPGEVTVDGAGGTLVPGMFEMHGHAGEAAVALNLAAGITTIRDMGNNNAELQAIIDRVERGESAGSRVVPSGFIEGRSPFSSNNGFVAETERQAVDAVHWYAARGYPAIKIYNSIKPEWVPAMVAEAKKLGMHVMGHVPAFATADDMMAAGYDELTHINQFVLGWVLKPGEDTRNLLRLTALRRLPGLDLDSAPVRRSIDTMVAKKIAIDPTLVIHETFTQSRDGEVPPSMAGFLDHMPISEQRDGKRAWVDLSQPGDDAAYRGAFNKLVEVLKRLNDRGVMIVPGTDMGGGFLYHRELELYQNIGMTPGQILKRATWDMAEFLGQDQRLGSIEPGKLADFFLVPGDPTQDLTLLKRASMVVKDGTVYFPSEIYPHFGIKPFSTAPKVTPVKK